MLCSPLVTCTGRAVCGQPFLKHALSRPAGAAREATRMIKWGVSRYRGVDRWPRPRPAQAPPLKGVE